MSSDATKTAKSRLDSARRGERYLAPAIFEPLARELLDRVEPEARDRLLDVACGSGVVGREAVRRGVRHVVGLDRNAVRMRAGAAPGPGCQARAEILPFRDASFSLVTCQHGFMFFDDRLSALRESRRVLAAGGRFAASCWSALEHNPGFGSLNRAVERVLGENAGAAASVPFSLPEPATLAREFEGAGFRAVATSLIELEINFPSAAEFARRFLVSTSLAPFVQGRDEALREILAIVDQDLGATAAAGRFAFPARAYCVVGENRVQSGD